jgi:nucleolar protein 9
VIYNIDLRDYSITSLTTEDLISLSQNPISSRVIDVLFESETVPFKLKRAFVMSLIGHYHTLVDDRIGSRVGDRCWAFADPYLRVGYSVLRCVHRY